MGLNLGPPPVADVLDVTDDSGKPSRFTARFREPFIQWFKAVGMMVFDLQNNGTTAQRPTENLYVGKPYFDTTLGYRVNYNGAAWVRWDGAVV